MPFWFSPLLRSVSHFVVSRLRRSCGVNMYSPLLIFMVPLFVFLFEFDAAFDACTVCALD